MPNGSVSTSLLLGKMDALGPKLYLIHFTRYGTHNSSKQPRSGLIFLDSYRGP